MNLNTIEAGKMHLNHQAIAKILAAHDEACSEQKIGHYATLGELAAKVRSSKNWSIGEVFACALEHGQFVIMKQIAPSSCEMMTVTQNGFHDVLTASRFEQQELVDQLLGYIGGFPKSEAKPGKMPQVNVDVQGKLAPMCPTEARGAGGLIGCGSSNVSPSDEEGFYDCRNCGLFFKPEAEAEKMPDGAILLDYIIADNAAVPFVGIGLQDDEGATLVSWDLPVDEAARGEIELLVMGSVDAANESGETTVSGLLTVCATHCRTRRFDGAMTVLQQVVYDRLLATAGADRKLPDLVNEYLIFSQSEAEAATIREGFWSNEHGWGDFRNATRFKTSEREALTLPVTASNDARLVDADELAPFFKEQEQRAKLAHAIAVLSEQVGIQDPLGSKRFFTELLESVETLSGIADQYGSRTLADLMYLQNAIANGSFVDHAEESSLPEVVKMMPSADRWLKHVQILTPQEK